MGALRLGSRKVASFRNLSETSNNDSSLGRRRRRRPDPSVHFVAAGVLVVMVIVECCFSRLLKSWREMSVGQLGMPRALCQGRCHRAPQDVWVKRQTLIVWVLEAGLEGRVPGLYLAACSQCPLPSSPHPCVSKCPASVRTAGRGRLCWLRARPVSFGLDDFCADSVSKEACSLRPWGLDAAT